MGDRHNGDLYKELLLRTSYIRAEYSPDFVEIPIEKVAYEFRSSSAASLAK